MDDNEPNFTCDGCGEKIQDTQPFYSNFISGDDTSACYDFCSKDCLLKFLADKVFDILKEQEQR